MKRIFFALMISTALLCSCMGMPDYTKNSDTIIVIKKQAARKDGSLYILPSDDYALLRDGENSIPVKELVCAAAPLIIKGNEINEWTVKYCLDKFSAYYPLKTAAVACSYSNKSIVENALSDMGSPVLVEFRETPGEDIEFYIEK